MTASSFAPQRDETWTLHAHRILANLRSYERNHPTAAPCLTGVLREMEAAVDPLPEPDPT